MAEENALDVAQLIDERDISRVQIITIVLCALVTALDGIDTQSIGAAAPLIAKTLHIAHSQFGLVFSSALFGALVGATVGGPIADRHGRKRLLVISTALFGIFTFITAYAASFQQLLLFRFLAGIALGGALPCFLAMTSEFAPKRLRATLVALMWSCFALGGMMGGFMNGFILHHFGWRDIFHVGGVLPLIVAALVLALMPESLNFLITHGADPRRIQAVLRRMYGDIGSTATRFVRPEQKLRAPMIYLFAQGRAASTVLLWIPFFLGFGTLAISTLWTPTLLTMSGMAPAVAANLIGIFGLGAFLGNASAGKLLSRFGINLVPVPSFLLGAVAFYAAGHAAGVVPVAAFCLFFTGVFLGLSASSCVVLASTLYPKPILSTGTGWAMGAARLGQVVLPLLLGAMLAAHLTPPQILTFIALAPILGAVALVLLNWQLRKGGMGEADLPVPAGRAHHG